ncbi:hypothetical protein P171DRAFT_483278 [Karstenula rhodostoma CBS 690.94]|uniref:Ubiquitin 3 binding protein But2 C-terminal domain-containing protein n=1 Tax=Karstenula rhodostoma CBS 690.94 TaxID=1392251 RepID=A0A9P4UEL2_9PLEO|nr:hypothetical protein P171DRAFT_483278 [Karstenula rhodostoma CBS 690.94]
MHLSLLLFLSPLAIASPSSSNDTQTWTITRLDYHYMTDDPGFGPPRTQRPGTRRRVSDTAPSNANPPFPDSTDFVLEHADMPWPASAVFNTTLSFDVSIPRANASNGSWHAVCELSWDRTTRPEPYAECVEVEVGGDEAKRGIGMGGVYFTVEKWNATGGGDAVVQMPFILKMWRFTIDAEITLWEMFGNATISCDDPGSPTSYLTCMMGRPLDGMRCKLHSLNNVDLSNKKELQIVAERCREPGECPM